MSRFTLLPSEIIKAKDTVIEGKNASIDAIKENTPQFVSAAYKATVEMFEDNFKRMQEKLAQTEKEISNLESLKVSLSEEIHNLQEEKNELMSENEYLRPLAEAMEGYIDHQKDLEAEGLEDVAW